MVRRVIVVDDGGPSDRPPLALPSGPTYPDPDPSDLPTLSSMPLLSEDERASAGAKETAARFLLCYSATSARSRAGHLHAFFAYCDYRRRDPLDADEAFLAEYASDVQSDVKLSSAGASIRLSVVRAFYRFAVDDRLLPASPAAFTSPRANAVQLPPLTIDARAVAAHEAAAAFLLGYSAQTRRLYEDDLRSFFGWCFRARINPLEATRPHVEAWRLYLEEQGKSPASSNRALSAVRSFFKYCVEEDILDRSPAASVRQRRIAQAAAISDGLDRHEAITFLDAARATNPLYHAVLSLLLLNGLRAAEPGTADLDRMTTNRGHRLIYVSRKGYADQWAVPLAPYTAGAIDEYLARRGSYIPAGHPEWTAESGPMFITPRGVRPSRGIIYDWVRRVSLRAFPLRRRPVHPHELRATFITLGLDAGVTLRDVQDAAGHANPLTTRRYDRGRHSLDRHATYTLATYLATGASRIPRHYDETPPEGVESDDGPEPRRP